MGTRPATRRPNAPAAISEHGAVQLRSISAAQWREYRAIRLAALRDAPTAFARTYAEEAAFADDAWQARARASEEGKRNTIVVAGDCRGSWLGLAGGYRPGE